MLEKSLNDTINACIKIPNTFHIQICFNIVVIKKKKTTTTTRCVTSRVWVWNYCLEWLKVRGLRFIFLGYHYPINLILIYDKKINERVPMRSTALIISFFLQVDANHMSKHPICIMGVNIFKHITMWTS